MRIIDMIIEHLIENELMFELHWVEGTSYLCVHWEEKKEHKALIALNKKFRLNREQFWDRYDSHRFYWYVTKGYIHND